MAEFSTWWRKAGGMLAAVVLAIMMFGPVAEAAVCADDTATAAATVDEPAGALADAGPAGEAPCDDGSCPCIHCHGHHAGAYAPVSMIGAEAPFASRERHDVASGPSPASSLTFGFKRPPRG